MAMLPEGANATVRELILAGRLSRRQIAEQVGVSLNTVVLAARDLRGLTDDDCIAPAPLAEVRRCPDCGSKLPLWPCVACTVETVDCATCP